jgi:ADP-ribose pyrophosphatase YjhB (NUDIX family)
MTYEWANRIRPLALCVVRRDDGAVLLAPGYDNVKQQRFYRPLGGEIEFGERAEEAARRELLEETGAEVTDLRLLLICENLFTFLGAQGHELVWTFEGRFADASMYQHDVVVCDEGGANFEAHWMPLDVFLRHEAPLYPDGLLEALTQAD